MILFKKDKKKVFFSVITVTKNSQLKLERCINSVFDQSFRDYEHIIVDGESDPETIELIKKNSGKIDLAISEKDKNLWEAINKGIKISNGEIICILNSDDFFYKDALKIAYDYFARNDIDYLFGSVLKAKVYHNFYPKKIFYKFNIFPSHSVGFFVKKKIHDELGLYNENLDYCADYDLIYRLVRSKKKYMCTKIDEVFGEFSYGGISSKINILKKIYYESKVRINNKQNKLFVYLLGLVNLLNYLRVKLLIFLKIKKDINW